MSNVFKKLNYINIKLQDQFDNAYSTISRWNDVVLDYLTTREDRGDILAVCISGLRSGQNNGSSTYQYDASRFKINGNDHLAIKVRRKGIEGLTRPDMIKQAKDSNESQFLIGMHEFAYSDKPIENVSSVPPGSEVKCYFADGREFGLPKKTLFFRADQIGGSYINFMAVPFKDGGDNVSDSFNNVQNLNFLGSITPDGTNGKLFPNQLRDIGGGYKMAEPAASAYINMRAAAQAAGITWTVNEAYRTIQTQMAYDRDPCLGRPAKGRYGVVYNCNGKQITGLAAKAGTSNHGFGRAIDINVKSNRPAFQWLMANASRFKFYKDPKEDWHWEYRG